MHKTFLRGILLVSGHMEYEGCERIIFRLELHCTLRLLKHFPTRCIKHEFTG